MLPHAMQVQNSKPVPQRHDPLGYITDAHLQRDERVLVIWADSMDAIIPTCREFEDRLIKLLSRPRPAGIVTSASRPVSVVGGSSMSISIFSSAVLLLWIEAWTHVNLRFEPGPAW